jgi:general stress protein YciG
MPQKRGFAAMDERQRREIAAMGGRAAHESGNAHEWNDHEAAMAGRRGGEKVSRDRSHMAAIGRKGGLAAHQRQDKPDETNGNGLVSDGVPAQGDGEAHAAKAIDGAVASGQSSVPAVNGTTNSTLPEPLAPAPGNR